MTDPAHDPKTGKTDPGKVEPGRSETISGDTDASGRKGPARAAATVGPERTATGVPPGATSASTGAGAETEQPYIDRSPAEHPYTDQTRGDRPYTQEGYGERPYADAAYGEPRYADDYDERRGRARIRDYASDLGSVPQLLRRLVDDTATLVRKELALATNEISRSVDDVKTGAVSMVTGGAVLYLGIMFLLAAATLALALFMPGWAAALIVGGVVTLVGVIMLVAGKNKMEPNMKRTGRSLRKDRDMIERQTS
jgi:hypothetical protein